MTELPAFIAGQLPAGVHHHEITAGDQRVHAMSWGPGDGHAVVMLHGNPTWGFLWRKVVAEVRARPGGDRLRLIAPDLVGLGLSSKPGVRAHTLAHHGAWIGAAIDALAPGPVVIAVQDWGGPIALRAMADRLPRLRGMVLGNTAVGPPAQEFKPTRFHRISHVPVVSSVLFRGLGFPLRNLYQAQGDRDSIRGDVARAYQWPLRHLRDRSGPLALARMVPNSHHHPSIPDLEISERVYREAKVPVALVWGTRDPILGRVINFLSRLRPDATVTRTTGGHFLQEEVPDALAGAILDITSRATWS